MSLRKIVSLTTLLSFTALVFTGVFSYLAPRGPGSGRWGALGLDKHEWFALHTNVGILFLIAGVAHTILNIKPIIAYLRNRQKKLRVFTLNFNFSLLLTIWVIAGSILDWVPFSAIRTYKEGLGGRSRHHPAAVEEAAASLPEKPPLFYGGRSLAKLCSTYALDTDVLIRKLEELGITAEPDWSINRIADTNGMESRSVYDTIRQLHDH